MIENLKTSSLMQRLKDQDNYSIAGDKPQDLSLAEIRSRVEKFLIKQEGFWDSFAFAEGVAIGNVDKSEAQFDPIKSFQSDPDKLEEITMLVEYDILVRESELLEEAASYKGSYNTLLFAAAFRLLEKKELSDALMNFLVTHLISPRLPPKNKVGKPKITSLDVKFRWFAIKFASQHGIPPTRNDASQPHSACDVVSEAAKALYQTGLKQFGSGYGYESLKKTWQKNKHW